MTERTTNEMIEQIIIQISLNVKRYRIDNKMTQSEMAAAIGIDTQYYGQLERGERHFQIEKIIKLCSVLHVGIQDLVEINPVDFSQNVSLKNTLERLLPLLSIYSASGLSDTQLQMLEKFITEFLPHIK